MKKNNSLKLLSLILILLLFACNEAPIEPKFKYPPNNEYKVTISQGVWGNVWFWEGDFMPIIDPKYAKITPVVRNIFIYEATRFDSVIRDSGSYSFIKSINSNFVAEITSDKDGFFQINLPPGKYSFFVKEDSLFFANGTDGDGYIMPAEVIADKVTKRQININYKAVY